VAARPTSAATAAVN